MTVGGASEASAPLLFGLQAARPFAERIAAAMSLGLAEHEERAFEHGEHKSRPLVEVARRNCFVIQSLAGDAEISANDRLVQLLFFIACLRDQGAASITAVAPYLAYARKERRTKPRDPVNSRYVAQLFESVGTDRMITFETHNLAAFENAFRTCCAVHVSSARLMAEHVAASVRGIPVSVVSPDPGGMKRAQLFRSALEAQLDTKIPKAILDKHRSMGAVTGSIFAGDVDNRVAIVVDDLVSGGTTILKAAEACRKHGATRVIAVSAHGLFVDGAPKLFGAEGPDEIIVTDSVAAAEGVARSQPERVTMIGAAPLFAEVINALHSGRSVSDLLHFD